MSPTRRRYRKRTHRSEPLRAVMNHLSCTTEGHIRTKVRLVVDDETLFSVLSRGERIAVALVLDRYDLLQRAWGSIAESTHRLGPEWTEAALRVQRSGCKAGIAIGRWLNITPA